MRADRRQASVACGTDPEAVSRAIARRHGDPIEVRETHISWVFLAEDRAYKLKKALVLPFLDYGTPQARRRMCELEVELNRRLAPDVYLGVVGLAADGDGLRLVAAEDPEAIEHLVEMLRFDETSTLAARLRAGRLERYQVAEVGELLASFHAAAAKVSPEPDRAGAVRREFCGNIEEAIACTQSHALRRRLLRLAISAQALTEGRAVELEARGRRGRLRECHGDLRAEHVLIGRPPQVVDCIEFDPALRRLDVADDIAFLVMDLWSMNAEEQATELLAAYRAAGGDCGDDRLVALFALHRALVRAKVALIGGSAALAERLVSLAARCAWRAREPCTIVVCGVPASGKSVLAQALARASGAWLLSSDETRKRLLGVTPSEPAGSVAYRPAVDRATYVRLGELAQAEVSRDSTVIVDATFRRRADRRAFADARGDAGRVLFVECRVPRAVLEQRARDRDALGRGISDADLQVVLHQAGSWESLDEVAPADHVLLRADRPVDQLVAEIVATLDARLLR